MRLFFDKNVLTLGSSPPTPSWQNSGCSAYYPPADKMSVLFKNGLEGFRLSLTLLVDYQKIC